MIKKLLKLRHLKNQMSVIGANSKYRTLTQIHWSWHLPQ